MSYDYRNSHTMPGKGARYHQGFQQNPHRAMVWKAERRFLDDIVKRFFTGRSIQHLDFACGTGRILAFLESRTDSSLGVDLSAEMLKVARENISRARIVQEDLTHHDVLDDSKFNLITAFRFFPNAQPELRKEVIEVLVKHLADDGYLVFNNHMNLSSSLRRLQRVLRCPSGNSGMSEDEVRAMVTSAELRIIKTYHVGVMPVTEGRLILPVRFTSILETVASAFRGFRRLAQDVIYVCAHAGSVSLPGT